MAMALRLDEDERAALERIRVANHHTTASAALRALIRQADPDGDVQRQRRLDVDDRWTPTDRETVEDTLALVVAIARRFGIEADHLVAITDYDDTRTLTVDVSRGTRNN